MKKYDDILIGSGPAAYKMANLLAKVLVVRVSNMGELALTMGANQKFF